MIGAPEQQHPDHIKTFFKNTLKWITKPNSIYKLTGSLFSILFSSMLYTVPFVGLFMSSMAITLGFILLPKIAQLNAEFNSESSLITQYEKYILLCTSISAVSLLILSPSLLAGLMIISSGPLGYLYVQDVLLSPLSIAAEEQSSLLTTLGKIYSAFSQNENLLNNLKDLIPDAESTVDNFINAAFNTMHEILISSLRALQPLNIFLRSMAPNQCVPEDSTHFNASATLTNLLENPVVNNNITQAKTLITNMFYDTPSSSSSASNSSAPNSSAPNADDARPYPKPH